MEFNSESRDTRIYIVDDHYRIVYFNHALGEVFPSLKMGELCYRALCGESAPCSDCPLGQEDGSDSIFYNQLVDQWVEVNTGRIEWPGPLPCCFRPQNTGGQPESVFQPDQHLRL